MTWYSMSLLLSMLFRMNGKIRHLDENDFCHWRGNFFRKWHSESFLTQVRSNSPLSTITRHIDNSILKDIHNSIFYGHGSTCVLNLSSDFGKRHWNENQWRWMEKDQSRKNSSVHLAEYLNQNRNHVSHFVPLFFSQT